mmetsp:Transcript_23944/g.66344  ORF Transcript_23944/g.66344 Transcript_23944/m.66344 type:complete len:214 (+) Transcript_23944:1486-2127(+)
MEQTQFRAVVRSCGCGQECSRSSLVPNLGPNGFFRCGWLPFLRVPIVKEITILSTFKYLQVSTHMYLAETKKRARSRMHLLLVGVVERKSFAASPRRAILDDTTIPLHEGHTSHAHRIDHAEGVYHAGNGIDEDGQRRGDRHNPEAVEGHQDIPHANHHVHRQKILLECKGSVHQGLAGRPHRDIVGDDRNCQKHAKEFQVVLRPVPVAQKED